MAAYSQQTTAITGQTLTAAIWNNEFQAVANSVNSVTNAQVASNAGITASKIAFGGTSGQVLKSDGSGGLTYGGAGRAFPWGVTGTLVVADEQGMKYIVPQNMTVNKLWAKTDSGTCDIRIQRDTTDVDSTFSVTSSVGSTTSFESSSLTAGEVLTLDVIATSSGSGLFVMLECTQS